MSVDRQYLVEWTNTSDGLDYHSGHWITETE